MSTERSIQVNVPVKFALQKTWEMHFEDNQFTQNTYAHPQGNDACQRQVHLRNGNSVRQKISLHQSSNTIVYQNLAGYVSGKMEMRFQPLNNNPQKTKIIVITWSKTKDNQIFPNPKELQDGLQNSKSILQASYKIDQEIPKCCQCKLFG